MTYSRFEDLPVWQEAIRLVGGVYDMTESREWRGSRSLRDQIERAALSVSNNIAEGFERGTPFTAKVVGGFKDYDDPQLHALALRLRELVPDHRLALIDVIREDRDSQKRASAATMLHWGGDVADSIARVNACANDPTVTVRNNVTRFMLHYLDMVESPEVRTALIASLARQLRRPSHADRNKAVYGLLHIMQAFPADGPAIAAAAQEELRMLARDSVLFNVGDPARELIALLEGQ